jgi:Major Facilitator Superfamily
MTASVPPRVGLYVAVVQFFFALSWTVYVIYLPQLAAQAGIPKSAVIWLLMLDQLVFLVADYACGVASDHIANLNARLGPVVLAATGVSSIAFLLLPLLAPQGSPALFIGTMVVWTIGSSALRAPPLNIIGRYAARPSQPALVALTMFGLGLAGAVSPYLGVALKDLDPRWPFALSSAALVATTLGLVGAERSLQRLRAAAPAVPGAAAAQALSRPLRLPWAPCLVAAVLAALAFQVHVFLNSTPLYLRHASAAELQHLAPVFWVGFNLGLWPASVATRRYGGIAVMAVAGVAAAGAAALAVAAGSLGLLLAAQALAGLAWAAVLMSAFTAALALGHTGAEGRFSGALSSALALSALLRMGLVAGGVATLPPEGALRSAIDWMPAVLWFVAGVVLLGLWRGRPQQTALAS